jgi:adenylate cyclase
MESPQAYTPTDRRLALLRGEELPERSQGAALFADISGFTPLTEALVRALGPQRGAEELPRQLNLVYDALITEVDQYGGCVISFSGDAITCWFDGDNGLRAASCALRMQQCMQQFARIDIPGAGVVSLGIKVAVAVGPVRRFVTGDPAIHLLDALAGNTLHRLAAAEHLAGRGEVLIDQLTAGALGEHGIVGERRIDEESGEGFLVLTAITQAAEPTPWPPFEEQVIDDAVARTWMLPPAYQRLQSGMGEFLTELRPAVALFVRFGGIDYELDEQAPNKLNTFILSVQQILQRYESYILQLTIGDKGSYLYTSFGAPVAHEDDAIRAAAAALEIRDLQLPFITSVQIGISHGRMRIGAYGGVTRRTYGVLGDEVNLAARLMQNAAVGEIIASQAARKLMADAFEWEQGEPLTVKGKSQPVVIFRLLRTRERRTIRLQEPRYALPMIGRQHELALIVARMQLALAGPGQVIGITAEAGLGKSRLTAEVVRIAQREQMIAYGGECQSYGTNTSYLVWQNIWRGFFGINPSWSLEEQISTLETQIRPIDPALLQRLPLLGAVLNIAIPDTELTRSLDAKLRKESLESLLVDCLRARAAEMPLLLVLEDCHWLDPLSHDLAETIARAIADLPILMILAYRPPQVQRLFDLRLRQLLHFSEIPLANLPADEILQLVQSKLVQVYGSETETPAALVETVSARAQGNPFYIEELLNYFHDRAIDPRDPAAMAQIELPTSLYSLILSRIDQLSENQKTLLKVASVIGRLFRVAMLWGVYNQFGNQQRVRHELDILSSLELTPLDTPDPELAYLFKHVVTQEVAYETLPYAMRSLIHGQIGDYIEHSYADTLDQYIDLLAHHYSHSTNQAKQREYLLKAGIAAQAAFANAAAINYYRRLLPMVEAPDQSPVMLRLAQVLELVGEWDEAEQNNRLAREASERLGDMAGLAASQHALGSLLRKRGRYAEAQEQLQQAQTSYQSLGNLAGMSMALVDVGEVYRMQGRFGEARQLYEQSLALVATHGDARARQQVRAHALKAAGTATSYQGDFAGARALYEESMAIRHILGDRPGVAVLLNNQGIIARHQHQFADAHALNAESILLFRELGDRWSVGQLLNNQACVAADQGNFDEARKLIAESLLIRRQIGDRAGLALSLNTLADMLLDQGDFTDVRAVLDESLAINRELGDQTAIAYLLEDYAGLAAAAGAAVRALQIAGYAAALRNQVGAPLPPTEQARVDRMLAPARSIPPEQIQTAWEAGQALEIEAAIALARSIDESSIPADG